MFVTPSGAYCPHCKRKGDLWIRQHILTGKNIVCMTCGGEWNRKKLIKICYDLARKENTKHFGTYYADCFRILMHYTINPFTGLPYA